jgi:hypothetical protein
MSSLLLLAPVVVAVGLAWRWTRSRRHLDLAAALDAPWFLWPLSRLAIYRYMVREAHADLWEQTGMFHLVDNKKHPLPAWRCIFIDKHNDTWRVRIRVRRGFPQGDEEVDGKINPKKAVVNNARGTLDLGKVEVRWHWRLWLSHVEITPRRVLPAKAFFRDNDVRELVEAELTKNPTALPYMLLGKDEPYSVDLDDIPHVGISAGTGGGKSALIRFLVAAPLWADPRTFAIVADRKEFSQRGLAEIPGVIYARDPEEINNVLIAVWEEVERRNKECASYGLNRLPDYPRIVLGLEEINITYQSLNSWWRQNNGYQKGLAPGIYALDQILCAGRQVKVNCIIEGQDVNNRVVSGSGAGTVNIDEWILANYDPNTWKRLAMGHEWVQPSSHPGWCIAIRSRQLTEGQRIFMADGERKHGGRFDAYEWLKNLDHSERQANLEQFMLNGGLLELSPSPASPTPPPSKTMLTPELGHQEPVDHDEEPNYRTLRELESRPWCPWRSGTLARYARDPLMEFPDPQIEVVKGVAGRYSERAVREWTEDRLLGGGNKDYGVYFVVWALADGRPGVKIGMTGNLKGRFRKWNLGTREWPSPFLLHWIPCDDKYAAKDEEDAQHDKWHDYHDHLELFRREGELATWLERQKVAA